eukprot:TRINITY_DN1528_c0_g1_i3.p1 TRINITY_DN1528_c0_g1~~TRINITY_DN1528_c0_g1_i3.p1  ORF type:complete len:283 (+),score=83.69 TRINITY_DN1528_c0_g1_i3:124-972(+)
MPKNSSQNVSLEIDSQESIIIDKFTRNGVEKELHIVAKVIPFIVHVSTKGISLHEHPLGVKLIYDYDNENEAHKEVGGHKMKLLEYIAHVASEGNKAKVEIKINALSSQHEGTYFRVAFSVANPHNSSQPLQVISQPIKVVSKKTRASKSGEKMEKSRNSGEGPTSPQRGEQLSPPQQVVGNKRDRGSLEIIAETLLRLERSQEDQAKLMDHLLQQRQPPTTFESACKNFFDSYYSLDEEERSRKMRRMIQNGTERDIMAMNSFMRTYVDEIGESVKGAGDE